MRLTIDDTLLHDVIAEVGPLVEGITGWELGLEGLGCRIIPRQRAFEEVLLGRMQGMGIAPEALGQSGLAARLLEFLIEGNVQAAYDPGRGVLLFIRENVDDSNPDGLRVIVAHELVHRGQHLHHAELFSQVDGMMADYLNRMLERGIGIRDTMRVVNEIQPPMTLLESHAFYVQESLRASHFPEARIESHFSLPTLLFRLFGARKLAQYTDGFSAVAEASERGEVDGLYADLAGARPGRPHE
ncbi:MAG: hypothetical protein ACYDCO_24725 [Armatimonadota bacterium]